MLNLPQLDTLVAAADPALSDADLAAQLSTQTKTPKRDRITITSLAATWGPVRAGQFLAALQSASASNPAAVSAVSMLNGPGFDATNPATPPTAGAFVAAGLCSQAEADAVLYDVSFPAGDVVQASDVTASRARVSLAAGKASLLAWLEADYIAAIALCDEGQRSGTLPIKAQLQAAFDPTK